MPPRSVQLLGDALARGRVFSDETIFPSPPAIRNSLFPNTALLYDKASAQIYSSLAFGRHQAYVYNMSPAMLDLIGARFVMIPLEPRAQTHSALLSAALGAAILRDEIVIEPTPAHALQIVSATEQAANLLDGALVAEIVVRFDDGATQVLPARVGVETADWDFDRKRAHNAISHARAPIAHSFPAYWRAFGRAFNGHTFRARYEFASPRKIVGVSARVLEPEARLMIESIALETPGQTVLLARLIGKNDFRLAYMSDTVAAWENRDALPRAFVTHQAIVQDDDAAFARMHAPAFRPDCEVLLADAPVEAQSNDALANCAPPGAVGITRYQPERVEITATTDQPGYLVLTDSWYPGWNAFVDGQPAPIYRADVLFRAVAIEPGTHNIVFEYCPSSFTLGAAISGMSLLIVFGFSIFYFRFGKTQ